MPSLVFHLPVEPVGCWRFHHHGRRRGRRWIFLVAERKELDHGAVEIVQVYLFLAVLLRPPVDAIAPLCELMERPPCPRPRETGGLNLLRHTPAIADILPTFQPGSPARARSRTPCRSWACCRRHHRRASRGPQVCRVGIDQVALEVHHWAKSTGWSLSKSRSML